MNFAKVKDKDPLDLPVLLKSRLGGLVAYIRQKMDDGELDALSLTDIAKDNRMTLPQLMDFGFTKANLVCHAVVASHEQMVQKFVGTQLSALGATLPEQIKTYLLALYQHDVPQIDFRCTSQGYAWQWSLMDEERIINQAMKLMTPVYLALFDANFTQLDARCQAIWALYQQGLRVAAVQKGTAEDCLQAISPALDLLMEHSA